ncbi:MAG: hypothetical protein F6J87_03630 [Spirulina sp. SIO3F2]|nr:hypothetical protein [Spirulina sp. SIO3F2]
MKLSEINALGQSLRRIDQTLLNPAKTVDSERIWYQGGEPYFDVFIERHQNTVEWFQITLRGRSLSWHRQHNHWHTGHTNEMQTDDISFYPASKVIESDQRPDRQFLQTIEAILQSRAGEAMFDQLLAIFAAARTQTVLD